MSILFTSSSFKAQKPSVPFMGLLPASSEQAQVQVLTQVASKSVPNTQHVAVQAVAARSVVVASGDAALRGAVAAELERLRWSVRQAGTAAEMVALLDGQRTAAAIVDSWLPDLDVRECIEDLRVSFPELDIMTLDGTDVGAPLPNGAFRNEIFHAIRQAQQALDGASAGLAETSAESATHAPQPSQPSNMRASDAAAWSRSLPEAEIVRRHMQDSRAAISQEVSHTSLTAASPAKSNSTDSSIVASGPAAEAMLPEFVGTDPRLREVSRRIQLVAHRKTAVLVNGPTGTGKELVARAIHRLSGRSGRFIAINCAAIPEALVEAELFGHARGAFTGAQGSRVGKIEAAAGGTVFLDEIGELPYAVQSKLLRFLESGEVQRVGENEPTHVDVRVVAATHRKLGAMTVEGSFRLDLLHRLSVFLIHTPALVGRRDDIDALISHTLAQLATDESPKQLNAAAREKLLAYNWPGNVRELAHTLERAWILSGESALIDEECVDFGESLF